MHPADRLREQNLMAKNAFERDPSRIKCFANYKLLLVFILIAVIWPWSDIQSRIPPCPPLSDQDYYLHGGAEFARHFVVLHRAPFYSIWMAFWFVASGENLHQTYYTEKIASVILLATLTGFLSCRLFTYPCGVFIGCWLANCHYFLHETNGSHALAAALYVGAALCLFLPWKSARIPSALLMSFLSIQARSEMWIPFLAIVAILVLNGLRGRLQNLHPLPWLMFAVIIGMLIMFISARSGPPEQSRFAEAFRENYAKGYVERNNLSERYPDPWGESEIIWEESMPGATSILGAIREYPGRISQHCLHNVRMMPRAIGAMIISIESFSLMLASIAACCIMAFSFRSQRMSPFDREAIHYLLLWGGALVLLIPLSIVFRVAARYYIQLVPFMLIGLIALLKETFGRVLQWSSKVGNIDAA
jgi:hypothetical protein